MIITICIIILAYALLGKPVDKLIEKLKDIDWKMHAHSIWDSVKTFCISAGITVTYPLLTFYYVMTDENTSITDKAMVYGALLYIISPFDLVPRRLLRVFGILDDVAVTAFVFKKISSSVTPEIRSKVEETIREWFGNGAIPGEPVLDAEGNIIF